MKSILITGAASGMGQALALRLAKAGCTLQLGDMNGDGLAHTATRCRDMGATVTASVINVSDRAAMENWIGSCGRIDLVLGCAGVQFTSLVGPSETDEEIRKTIEINLGGMLNTVLPALAILSQQTPDDRGVRGQIAILASQGAFVSVPGASAYTASKAAVDNWLVGRAATAWRQGIYLTSICPGYVQTPMAEINKFPMHGLMTPDRAAEIILRRLEKRPVRIAFPWRMYAAARLGGLLPAGFPARMLARNFARKSGRT